MKNLINEITRIQEMMGVQVLSEGKMLKPLEKFLLGATEKLVSSGEKTISKEMEQAYDKALSDVILDATSPFGRKLETAGVKTLEDLANLEGKGFTKEEVQAFTKELTQKTVQKVEQFFPKVGVEAVDGYIKGQAWFKRGMNRIDKAMSSFAEGVPEDQVESVKDAITGWKAMKVKIENTQLSESEMKSALAKIDAGIAHCEEKLSKTVGDVAGTTGEKAAEQGVSEVVDEVSVTIDEGKLGDITSQPFTEEEVIKTVLPQLEEDIKLYQKGIWNSTTPQMREKWKLDVTKKTIQATKEALTLADGVIENNAKQLEAMEKIWANPKIDEGFKKKMIEQSLKDLGLKLNPKSWEWWKKGLLKGTGFGSTTPSVKEYMKKFLYINIVWSAIEVGFSIAKTSNSPGGQPNLIKDWDAFLAAYHPGDVLVKTFVPFFLGRVIVFGINALTNEYRIPSSTEVQEFLAKNGVNTPSQYEYKNNETAGTLDVYKGSDILGQFKYNNDKNKIEPFGQLKPELTPSGDSTTTTNPPVTGGGEAITTAEVETFLTTGQDASGRKFRKEQFTATQKDANTVIVEFGTGAKITFTKENGKIKH